LRTKNFKKTCPILTRIRPDPTYQNPGKSAQTRPAILFEFFNISFEFLFNFFSRKKPKKLSRILIVIYFLYFQYLFYFRKFWVFIWVTFEFKKIKQICSIDLSWPAPSIYPTHDSRTEHGHTLSNPTHPNMSRLTRQYVLTYPDQTWLTHPR
jgi:hypothetical protein